MTKFELLQRWFSQVWVAGDASALDVLLSPEINVDTVFDGFLAPRNELPELIQIVHQLIGPFEIDITLFIEDDDWCSANYVMTADGPYGITPVSVGGLMMARVKNNQFIEMTTKFDAFTLFEQLGQLPEDALMACLTGQKLSWA
ncbi:MAG: nuclear transport factor 2 family protein [Rhodobacteraceae bacterium]|nr:nuclear transport factor 2 family protein [Paracoccaceae bacterium]